MGTGAKRVKSEMGDIEYCVGENSIPLAHCSYERIRPIATNLICKLRWFCEILLGFFSKMFRNILFQFSWGCLNGYPVVQHFIELIYFYFSKVFVKVQLYNFRGNLICQGFNFME